MFPWLWVWAPNTSFPLSGDVTQDIMTRWFSQIPEGAGDPVTERAIFEDTSYGRQLGLLIEVVAGQLEDSPVDAERLAEAEKRLMALHQRIEAIKASHAAASEAGSAPIVERLKAATPAELAAVRDYLDARDPGADAGAKGS